MDRWMCRTATLITQHLDSTSTVNSNIVLDIGISTYFYMTTNTTLPMPS